MIREEKDLVMKDLCSRLPYGVYVQIVDRVGFTHTLVELNPEVIQKMWSYKSIKPYLRPMSSMTEEEYNELADLLKAEDPSLKLNEVMATIEIDWLNKKMFDFRGLIPKDLALSTEEFNPYVED